MGKAEEAGFSLDDVASVYGRILTIIMREADNFRRKKLLDYLNTLDVTQNGWKEDVANYMYGKKEESNRTATFSVGDELENEIDEHVNDIMRKESHDVMTQFPEMVDFAMTERSLEETWQMWIDKKDVSPGDTLRLLKRDKVKNRELESRFDCYTAIVIRRKLAFDQQGVKEVKNFPYQNYDYTFVKDTCCENVIGYVPIPVGIAGPLTVRDGHYERTVYIPMATTEGALVASTNRGCSAIMKSGGVYAKVFEDKMTRAPVVRFKWAQDAIAFHSWLEDERNFKKIKTAFEEDSNFCRLQRIEATIQGNNVFVKFDASCGDAMGMNMVSKASDKAIRRLAEEFPTMEVLALSGNYCVDKKASAANWVKGRGKSVVAEAIITAGIVKSVLKTTPEKMEEVAKSKLSDGSAMAACIGGNNAHAANIVAAIFIATGQDAAQVISSGMCHTSMEVIKEGKEKGDLRVSVTMNCMEVGTVGGGTILPPQNELLQMLGCAGPNRNSPGKNGRFLAEVIASTVLAGELSLMAALCTDQLVSSHMKLNRSQIFKKTVTTPVITQPTITLPIHEILPERRNSRSNRNSESQPGCSYIM